MKKVKILSMLFLMGTLFFTSCKEKSKSEIAKEKIEEAAGAVGDLFKEESKGLKKEMGKAREELNKKISDLKTKLKDAPEDNRSDIQKGIDRLEVQRDKLDASLDKMGKNIKEDWKGFRSNIQTTLKEIRQDINSINN